MQADIKEKRHLLETAKKKLVQQFVGLDKVLDDVFESLSFWYLFPELQERPVVINMWGMTGVGKTSVVREVCRLLNLDKRYYHFDLGETDGRDFNMKTYFNDISENESGLPMVLALDEFQLTRTIDQNGNEIDRSSTRIIWQLLDSGKVQVPRVPYFLNGIFQLYTSLDFLLKNGVKVTNGRVVSGIDYFKQHREGPYHVGHQIYPESESKNDLFVSEKYYNDIFEIAVEVFPSVTELQMHLEKLNGEETVRFLYEMFQLGLTPRWLDCSKALIFVLGNLDEAYTMSSQFNPDMDADTFYEESLKINVPQIKESLKRRFRSEQISRLGNNHIIFPAISKVSYQRIIQNELARIGDQLYEAYNIRLVYDESIRDAIYDEGVYPTQGIRPVFSTVHKLVNAKLGNIFAEMIAKELAVDTIRLSVSEESMIAAYLSNGETLFKAEIGLQLELTALRQNTLDDRQAITAVHESGHVIAAILLLNTIPQGVYSSSASNDAIGLTHLNIKTEFFSRNQITANLAVLLAGFAAEKIVFGEGNETTGSESDIGSATNFLLHLLKESGMGNIPGSYYTEKGDDRIYLRDNKDLEINRMAEDWLVKAMALAEKTLKEQEVLLLKMSNHLSDHRSLTQEEIKGMVSRYAVNFDMTEIVEDKSCAFYRNQLKKRVESTLS